MTECITHKRSGSFTAEPKRLKPSDILEVFFLFSLALTGYEWSSAFKMQSHPLESEAVFVKSPWAQVAYLFVEAKLSWVVYNHHRFCKGISAAGRILLLLA